MVLGCIASVQGVHQLLHRLVYQTLFKQLGRWKSDSAKDGYVEDSKDYRLSDTRTIGI